MGSFPYRSWCAELAADFRRPIDPREVRFKVAQSIGDQAAQVVAYVQSRVVIARLNLLVPGRWRATHQALPAEMRPPAGDEGGAPLVYLCRLHVAGGHFEDVGEGQDPKAAFSDSLKRAAVRCGIGECLYAFRIPPLGIGEGETRLRVNAKKRPYLDRANERWLRGLYERWLTEHGIESFGEPLAHGPDGELVEAAEAEGGGEPAPAGDSLAGGGPGAAVLVRIPATKEQDALEDERPSDAGPAVLERVAAAARAIAGGVEAPVLARLGVLLSGLEPRADETPRLDEALAGELAETLERARAARWSAARLEEVTERALAAPRTPAERRSAFLAHLEEAAGAAGARAAA
jgi:hypothetical protein